MAGWGGGLVVSDGRGCVGWSRGEKLAGKQEDLGEGCSRMRRGGKMGKQRGDTERRHSVNPEGAG